MCRYGKEEVYSNKVVTNEQLHEKITVVTETVTPHMLQITWREIEYRLEILCVTRGTHINMY